MGSLVFQATLGGQVNLNGPNTASTFDIAVPATTGTMVTTGDSGTVTNTMLAASAYNTPGTIGSGTANSGAFTTLSASSTVSGAGFSTYLASPPAIGGTAAAAGTFTTLSGTTSVTTPIVKSASSLTLQTNGTTTAVTVDTSQVVAMGTTDTSNTTRLKLSSSPTTNRAVSAQLTVQRTNAATQYEGVCFNVGSARAAYILRVPGSDDLTFGFDAGASTAEAMRIDSSGKVGIGTTSPSGNLEVAGASGQNIYVTYNSGSQLRLKSDSGDSGIGTTGATPLLFLVSNGEKARIDTSGNLLVTGGGKLSLYGTPPNIGIDGTNATVTITNGNSIDFVNFSGTLITTETNSTGSSAILLCGGANTTVVGQANGTNFTNTSVAGNIRFFYNSGTTAYRLQNSSGSTLIFNIVVVKTRNST